MTDPEERLKALVHDLTRKLRVAVASLDSYHPRPWRAELGADEVVDDLDAEEQDQLTWVVLDADGDEVARSRSSQSIPSNGEWARRWVADVNALPIEAELE